MHIVFLHNQYDGYPEVHKVCMSALLQTVVTDLNRLIQTGTDWARLGLDSNRLRQTELIMRNGNTLGHVRYSIVVEGIFYYIVRFPLVLF